MKIKDLLNNISTQLAEVSPSARLDAEILLSYVLNQSKTFLYSYPDHELSPIEISELQELVKQRQQGKPIAYLIGKQAFWTFELTVTPDVLIPRPETEILVEQVLSLLLKDKPCKIADLGTGSGAIAIALALERPLWQVTAVDISPKALAVAQANAKQLGLNKINFQIGNWCESLAGAGEFYDCIVTNPPYIAEDDDALEANVRQFEPSIALISGETGLECIEILARTAKSHMLPGGYLLFEHGYQQHNAIKKLLEDEGYINILVHKDYTGHFRVTSAQKHFS